MDCPQCRRECGQNDKFCSECGYSLSSECIPVTELSVPGKLKVDLAVSISEAEPCRSFASFHRVVLLDLQPRTECTATVSTEMEDGVLSNATPKTFNRNPDQQEGPEHPISESQVHSDNHTHNDDHTHCSDHTHSDDNTQSQSLGPPDTGSPEDEEEETLKDKKEKEESQTSSLESENQQKDTTAPEHSTPGTPAPDPDQQEGPEHPISESQVHSDNHTHNDDHTHCSDHTHSDDNTQSQSLGPPDTGSPEDEEEETLKDKKEKEESQTSSLESENQQKDTTAPEHSTPGTPAPDPDQQEGPEHPISESQVHSDNHTHNDDHTHCSDHTHSDDNTQSQSLGPPDTGSPEDEEEETLKDKKEKEESQTSSLESENQQKDTTAPEHSTPGTPAPDPDQQEGPEHPISESQVHSDNHTHNDDHTHCSDHTHSDDNTQSQSLGPPDTGSPEDEEEETLKDKKESQTSLLESENQQRDTTAPEHSTPGTPAPDSGYQEETTDNTSSLGPEPALENPSSCLPQSQPISADPDKSDAKSGLADTDTMDETLSKDTKHTVCTAQENKENLKEQNEKDKSLTSLLGSENQQTDTAPAEHITPGTPAPGTSLDELLSDLGLERHLKNKLTLSKVLEIDGETLSDESIQSLKSLPWYFLRNLMMVNVTARSVRCASQQDMTSQNLDSLMDTLENPQASSNRVNPLDLITAVFLCSDGFLQQEMVLKMSMCQFSVPLLLPKCDTQQCTLMLWAMRDIVKKYKPQSLKDPKGFVEESIVVSELPMISFVRLGNSSLSKSHILNQLLSSPQEHHETFVHRNMECGNTPRRISNGLVEISWYLPGGKRNIDIFSEPLAIANLRGDFRVFESQYNFLCQTSAAIFVFCDDFGFDYKILASKQLQAHLYLIINSQSKSFKTDDFRRFVSELQIKPSNIIIKGPQMNDAEFVHFLRSAMTDILKGNMVKMSVEGMSAVAHEVRIQVDEDYDCCKNGKQKADEITERISDIPSFKEKELPMQGSAWKQLAKLEREECRMKNAGNKNIDVYRNELADQKQKLRAQQRAHNISESMAHFISAMSGFTEERKYFLKWMRIDLDNLSRKCLPRLRAEYKEQCQNSEENKERIAQLDREISSSSLGTEHFLREMGQLYEAACSLPEGLTSEIQRLPRLAAELLQEGFPLELVDGDASNIPLQWVTQVLKELHQLTQHECKIRVVTVLGVQSTGKSTLLNTMFGVQFAVSSGRCTRGAFMLLIRVKENFKGKLGCDYIMVIDTEGLKSPELAQLDDSYEHDNELATLVVGLSDITVINIAMENCTEMKDILQIVVHAFLRMKEVGRKPCCQLVHQNVPDVSAHENNLRERKLLLEQLNEMTQAAAKMEKRGNNYKFTDVMEYDPEKNTWYISGLWHGIPPMAPVNAGYSESVNLFKRSVIEQFKKDKSGKNSPHTFNEFLEWTKSLWSAVKYENFIFSFRNSLVADAYTQLCTEFNKLEWEFRKNMYSWLSQSETKVSNFGTIAAQIQPSSDVDTLMRSLKYEASVELDAGEKLILDKLTEFYNRSQGHVHLVEKYKHEFINTAKAIRMETENSVKSRLDATVEIRRGMFRLEEIKKKHTAIMEQKVLDLVEICRKSKDLSELETEFEKMWNETVAKLQFPGLENRDIVQDIKHQLWVNLEKKGSSVCEMLSKMDGLSECGMEPFKVKSEGMLKKIWNKFFDKEQKKKTQKMADHIIECSKQFVEEKVRTSADYHNTYMIDLLRMVDEHLDRHRDLETSAEFQASLKIHICGHAAREFQKMHLNFIRANDPRHCLEQSKQQYCTDFKDLFSKRDQCQKKAEEFACNCLAPAVKEYITKSLGPDLADEVLTGQKGIDFSTRSFFQFSILKQLLSDDNFKDFENYISNYDAFVQGWIFEQMVKQFSEGDVLRNIEIKRLKVMVKRLKEAIKNAEMKATERVTERGEEDQNIQQFIQDICSDLQELVIPKDPLEVVLALNTAKPKDFSRCLNRLVAEMEKSFTAEFQRGGDVRARLTSLPFQPQKELFNRVIGCGKQCPFCETPCEASGKNHTEHFASIHRPQGIGAYRYEESSELLINTCSSSVASERKFKSSETGGKWHPYKDYRSIYPDWRIQPDTSIQASDYWKYVFCRFNEQFAQVYEAEPADIPHVWRNITKDKAMKSLEESFQMKTEGD